MYAAIDNTVVLPAFTRLDGGLFFTVTRGLHAQLNVENLANRLYYPTSQGNNNIMPGAPRTLKLSLSTGV
jgi:catecholate siderophore receptor